MIKRLLSLEFWGLTMSKMLDASCVAGVVTSEGVPVPTATILSEGVGPSSGVLLLDEDKARYIAKISPDLKATIEKLIDALTETASALNSTVSAFLSIASGMTGSTTAPPPTLAADLLPITTSASSITATKVLLETLKEMLR